MEAFLKECKTLIEKDNLEALQEMYLEFEHEPYPWEYVFQKLYLHACLKKKTKLVDWLFTMYGFLDPIQQIALKPTLSYGKYLLAK